MKYAQNFLSILICYLDVFLCFIFRHAICNSCSAAVENKSVTTRIVKTFFVTNARA